MSARNKPNAPPQYPRPLPASGIKATEWALDSLFEVRKSDAWIAVVRDVKDGAQWTGGRYSTKSTALKLAPKSGHYVNTTIIRDGGRHRWDVFAESGAFLFCDDVGTVGVNPNAKMDKARLDALEMKPTLVVETSAGNFQYFYAFKQPVEPALYRALVKMLKANPGTRGGFEDGAELTRYGRLPSGINPKEGRGGFETRLVEGSGRKYTFAEMARGFGLDPDAIKPVPEPEPDPGAKPDQCSIETIEKLLIGPDAPLRNDGRFESRGLYVELIHYVHGASGGSVEGLDIVIRWGGEWVGKDGKRLDQEPVNEPELRWASIHSPRGGATALWNMARRMDPDWAARMMFDPIDNPADQEKPLDDERRELLVSAWLDRDIPLRDYLLGSVLCTTSRWFMFGETGVGKTLLALELAAAIASGSAVLGWAGRRETRVMYLDGELPAETFKERMQLVAGRYGRDISLYGYNREDLGDGHMPPLNEPEGMAWLGKEILAVKPELIVFDSIMALLNGVMAEEESWAPVKHLVRKLTARRIAQIWLHHTGHDMSKSFGTKTREWEMDTVAKLNFADESHEAFTIESTKARLRTPANAQEFKPQTLSLGPDGWISEPMRGAPRTGRKSEDVLTVRRAIIEAYDQLSATAAETMDADGKPVRKVKTDTLRDEVKSRGWLEIKETGGLTDGARKIFQRAKADLLTKGQYLEKDGWFWAAGLFSAQPEDEHPF